MELLSKVTELKPAGKGKSHDIKLLGRKNRDIVRFHGNVRWQLKQKNVTPELMAWLKYKTDHYALALNVLRYQEGTTCDKTIVKYSFVLLFRMCTKA